MDQPQWHADRLQYARETLRTDLYDPGVTALATYCDSKQRYCPQIVAMLYCSAWVSLFDKGSDVDTKLDRACERHTQALLDYQLVDVTFICGGPSSAQTIMRLQDMVLEEGYQPYRVVSKQYMKVIIPSETLDRLKNDKLASCLQVEHNEYTD